MEKYGVPYSCMREECRKYSGNNSKPNQEFEKLLQQYNIKFEREFSIEKFSYDFKVENMLFEINPTIFHNSTMSPFGEVKELIDIILPEDISSKIYRYNGVPINQKATGDVLETNIYQSGNIRVVDITSPSLNVLHCELVSTINVPANGTTTLDTRIPIFLDIGSN